MTLRLVGQGAEVLDLDGATVAAQVAAQVAAPWAIDANGRSLPTRYVVEGRALRQVVDVENATYPIVVDPWITAGWWYITPVYYVEMSWSETWSLKLTLDQDSSNIPGLLCGFIPTQVGKFTCGAIFLKGKSDVKTTVNNAIRARRCYKARIPASGGLQGIPAYDSYYVTCRK